MISALFWDITWRRVVIIYRRFGTTYRSHLLESEVRKEPLKMAPIRCPETSANNYHTTPPNIPEQRRYHQHRGGSLKLSSDDAKILQFPIIFVHYLSSFLLPWYFISVWYKRTQIWTHLKHYRARNKQFTTTARF
jgi:hypothetical protein